MTDSALLDEAASTGPKRIQSRIQFRIGAHIGARIGSGLAGIAALIAASLTLSGTARAEMIVTPLRQVVTAARPEAAYEVTNTSDRILDARVSWTDLAAVENGYAPADAALRTRLSAAPYLVVSPARFRIEPGKRARITVRLKKGATPPAGERRSHLLIETMPVRTPLRRAGGGLEVDVGLGVSTPVIVRGGLVAPKVEFASTRLVRSDEGALELATTLARSGKYSAYGRLIATFVADGRTREIARLENVAIHVDADTRAITLPLAESVLPAGLLTLSYIGAGEYEGREFAVKSFEIAPPK